MYEEWLGERCYRFKLRWGEEWGQTHERVRTDQIWSLNGKEGKKKVRDNADPKISSLSSQITDIINRVTVRGGAGL